MSISDNKAVAIEFIERFGAGDVDGAHELLAEDLVYEIMGDLPFSGSLTKSELRASNAMMVDLFVSPPKWIVDSAIAEGDDVAVISHSIGDTKGGFAYRNKYHSLFTIRDGLIVRIVEYMDTKHCQDLLMSLSEQG